MKILHTIDVKHFKDAGIKDSLIVEFLNLYACELMVLPDQFKSLMFASDYIGARKMLHSFKGASDVIGAYQISALMQGLENLIKNDEQIFNATQLVDEFRLGVETTLYEVRKLMDELSI
jgi:hypothetical protein